jgi:hypothetical protein
MHSLMKSKPLPMIVPIFCAGLILLLASIPSQGRSANRQPGDFGYFTYTYWYLDGNSVVKHEEELERTGTNERLQVIHRKERYPIRKGIIDIHRGPAYTNQYAIPLDRAYSDQLVSVLMKWQGPAASNVSWFPNGKVDAKQFPHVELELLTQVWAWNGNNHDYASSLRISGQMPPPETMNFLQSINNVIKAALPANLHARYVLPLPQTKVAAKKNGTAGK